MPALLYLLAVAVSAQGTSEFVLAGLLPGISSALDVSLPQAGLLTSGFAIGMVVGAPLMAIASSRVSPGSALTGSFGVLSASRIVADLANAGFLAVALSTVAWILPPEK